MIRALADLWPFVLRSTYERDVAELRAELAEERAFAGSLYWWRGGARPNVLRVKRETTYATDPGPGHENLIRRLPLP